MPTYVFAGIIGKLVKGALGALKDAVGKAVLGILSAIYEAIAQGIATLTDLFLAPLDMDLKEFKSTFTFLEVMYKWVLWFGVGLASLILIFQLFKTIFLKENGEHPARLLGRTAITIIAMFASTMIFDAALKFAKVPFEGIKSDTATYSQTPEYENSLQANKDSIRMQYLDKLSEGSDVRKKLEPFEDFFNNITLSNFMDALGLNSYQDLKGYYNSLYASIRDRVTAWITSGNDLTPEERVRLNDDTAVADSVKKALDNVEAESPSVSGRHVYGDDIVMQSEEITEGILEDKEGIAVSAITKTGGLAGNVGGYASYFILSLLLSILFIIFIAWNYMKLILECIERYVVLGVLYMTAPIPLAAGVSEETRPILKSWIRMCVSQILILFFSMWFIHAFGYVFSQATMNAAKHPGRTVFYLGMVLAFLKIGQHVDEYFGIVGMSAAKTGGNLLEDLALFKTLGGVGKMFKSAGGAVFHGAKSEKAPNVMDVFNGKHSAKGVTGLGGINTQNNVNSQIQRSLGLANGIIGGRVEQGKFYGKMHSPDGQEQSFIARKLTKSEEAAIKTSKMAVSASPNVRVPVYDMSGANQIGFVDKGAFLNAKANLKAGPAAAGGSPAKAGTASAAFARPTTMVPVTDKSGKQIGVMPIRDVAGDVRPVYDSAGKQIGTVSNDSLAPGKASSPIALKRNETLHYGEDGNPYVITMIPSKEMIMQNKASLDSYNLDGLDAAGLDLSGAMMRDCSLGGADFTGTNLKDAVLDNCDVNGLNARGAKLDHTEFNSVSGAANFTDAHGQGTRFINSDLHDSTIEGIKLRESNVIGTNFEGAKGRSAAITGSTVQGTSFNNSTLPNMELEGSTLKGNTFKAAVIPGIDMTNVNGNGNNFSQAQMSHAHLEKATMSNSNMERANASYGSFAGASLSGLNAPGATFAASDMRGTCLDYSKLQGASFERAVMDGRTTIQVSDLRNADLRLSSGQHILVTGSDNTGVLIPGGATFSEGEPFIYDGERRLRKRYSVPDKKPGDQGPATPDQDKKKNETKES